MVKTELFCTRRSHDILFHRASIHRTICLCNAYQQCRLPTSYSQGIIEDIVWRYSHPPNVTSCFAHLSLKNVPNLTLVDCKISPVRQMLNLTWLIYFVRSLIPFSISCLGISTILCFFGKTVWLCSAPIWLLTYGFYGLS